MERMKKAKRKIVLDSVEVVILEEKKYMEKLPDHEIDKLKLK